MKREYMFYLVFGLLAVLLLLTFGYESGLTAAPYRYWGGMMGGMMQMHHPYMAWGVPPAFWIFLILLVVFVYFLLEERKEPREDALSLLEKRYICGEIKREEYLQILKDLKKG